MIKIGTILLSHQSVEQVEQMVHYWRDLDSNQEFLVAYGGSQSIEDSLKVCDCVHVTDPELRTRDHPREKQSYLGVFKACVPWIIRNGITHIHFAEFDEIPLVKDLNQRLSDALLREDCDVLAHRLRRIDQTNHPHYLNHINNPLFMEYWHSVSCRSHSSVVLSMLGCGSFWTKESFLAVASLKPPLRIYLELFLPTAAHHLGYRIRRINTDDSFMAPEKIKQAEELEIYREMGADRVHPVKNMWLKKSS